jgi:RNA polymerase sigma-70 factor (ECF subfamily)
MGEMAIPMRKPAESSDNQATADALFRGHQQRIVRLCRMLLGNPDDADEVSQEVFLKMLGQREHGPEPADWRAWLTRVAINACHDRHRSGWWKWWKRDGRELLDTDLTSRDTVHEAISHEQTEALWVAFRKLTPRQQEVFILRQVEGWSTRETGVALELSEQAVKLQLFRALRRMRESLRSHQ